MPSSGASGGTSTYDEWARGKSKRSADYSFEACLRDADVREGQYPTSARLTELIDEKLRAAGFAVPDR